MSEPAIIIENLSKQYRLGVVGTGTLSHDLKRWWVTNIRGKEDPYLKIGEVNDRSHKGSSDYVWALKDINLEVQEGEVLGIIGKNGAGKSTLLKILSKVTKPSTGSIRYRGRIASLLEVGTGFHLEMTGRENIFMNGAIMGMTRAEIRRKFDDIVDFAGIERYIDTPVKRFSSGMTVRLGFAIAAHLEPEILVVDEVLAVGDAEFQKKAIGKMQEVSASKGRTVLFVSHNLTAVQNLCQKSILLENGKVFFQGSTRDVIGDYIHRCTFEQKNVIFSLDNAPGNMDVKLLKAEVVTEKIPIEAGTSVNLLFEFYHNSKEKAQYDVTFHLMDELNNLVFVGSTAFLPGKRIIDNNSLYKVQCTIPENILNSGTYSVSRLIYLRNRGQIVCEFKDTLTFGVIESSTEYFGWCGSKEGVIKPKLDWEIQIVND